MSGRRAFDAPGGDNVRIPAPSGPTNKSPERATTAFQNIDEMKRKEELFKQKLLAAEKDLAAAKEHARIKSMAPPLRGQSAAHEMHIEIFLPNADNSRQLILPGQLLVSQVKNAVWTSFASDLSGTTQAEFDLCLSVSARLQEDAELRDAHPSAAEAYRAWRPLKLYLYPIDDERRRKLDEQRREEAHLREEAARRRRRAEENERRRLEEEQKLLAASGSAPPPPVPRPASPPRGVIASVPALNTAAIADADRARSISPPASQERSLSPRGKSVRIGVPEEESGTGIVTGSGTGTGTGNSPREESATSPRKSVFGALLKELQPKSRSTRNFTSQPQPCKYGDRCQDNSKDHRTRFTHSAATASSNPNPNPNPNAAQPATSYAQLGASTPNISFVHEADEVDVLKAAAGVGARAKSPERGRVISAQEAMRPASPERAASPGRRQLSEAEKQELRLNQLASLGYADTELNTKYLAENNGNVAAASSALQRHYAERKPLPPLPTRSTAVTNPPVPAIANLVAATEKVHLSDPGLAPPSAGVPASSSGEALPPVPSRPAPVSPRAHYTPPSPLSSVSTPNLHTQLLDHQAKVAANSAQTQEAPVAKDPASRSPRMPEERKMVNNNNNELSTSVKPSDLRARGILSPTRSDRALPQPQARQAILSPPRAATVSSAQPSAEAHQRREAELLEKISSLEKVNAELRRSLAQSQESAVADTAKSADVARRLALTEARAVEAERQAAAKDAMLIEKERELASLRAQVIAAQAASPPPSPAASAPLASPDAEAKIRALEEKNAALNQKLEVVGKALKLFKAEKERFKQTEEELRATQEKLAYLQNLVKARAGTGAQP